MTTFGSNVSRPLFFFLPGNGGGGPVTALDANVFHAGEQARRGNNRGDTGNVVPGSIFSPSLVFSGLERAPPPGE